MKLTGYAGLESRNPDAGIPHYWIVDLSEPVSLVCCHLAGPFGYQDAPAVTDEFVTTVPFPVKLRVDRLR